VPNRWLEFSTDCRDAGGASVVAALPTASIASRAVWVKAAARRACLAMPCRFIASVARVASAMAPAAPLRTAAAMPAAEAATAAPRPAPASASAASAAAPFIAAHTVLGFSTSTPASY
jgi:hypothetical protein